jgi:hypothetical protein
MEIIETLLFTKRINDLLSDDEYRELQWTLVVNPLAGQAIPGGNGLRKIRWAFSGYGKRGGLRIIYYCLLRYEKIYLLLPYLKSEQEDLTRKQLNLLSNYIKEGVL